MRLIDLLCKYKINLAISFYMDNVLATLNRSDLVEVPVRRAMGIALSAQGLYLASKQGFSFFERIYHPEEKVHIYRQKITRYLGHIDAHEMVAVNDRPIFCNTLYGCLSSPAIERDFSIEYQPSFIKNLVPEDHCHLNGIAVDENQIRAISCFSPNNVSGMKSWKHKPFTGCVWDVKYDHPIIPNLAMPHSPRIVDGNMMVCDSGRGRVVLRDHSLRVVAELHSFTRGCCAIGDYILIGTSKVRESSKNPQLVREKLSEDKCGIHVLDRYTFKVLDSHYFPDKKEIFDFQIIPENHIVISADSTPFNFIHVLS